MWKQQIVHVANVAQKLWSTTHKKTRVDFLFIILQINWVVRSRQVDMNTHIVWTEWDNYLTRAVSSIILQHTAPNYQVRVNQVADSTQTPPTQTRPHHHRWAHMSGMSSSGEHVNGASITNLPLLTVDEWWEEHYLQTSLLLPYPHPARGLFF